MLSTQEALGWLEHSFYLYTNEYYEASTGGLQQPLREEGKGRRKEGENVRSIGVHYPGLWKILLVTHSSPT